MSSSNTIKELQNKIIQIKTELTELNKGEQPLPEFIDTANMIRTNEYLQKSNDKKSQLLSAYEDYTNRLEVLISTISKIKGDITRLNSQVISRKKPKKKTKTRKRKTKPKTRRKKSKTRKRKIKTRRRIRPKRKTKRKTRR